MKGSKLIHNIPLLETSPERILVARGVGGFRISTRTNQHTVLSRSTSNERLESMNQTMIQMQELNPFETLEGFALLKHQNINLAGLESLDLSHSSVVKKQRSSLRKFHNHVLQTEVSDPL